MKKILIFIATIVMFTSCNEKYNYKTIYTVKDKNDNVLFTDTVYREGYDYSKLLLWADVENYNRLIFDNVYSSDILIKTKQKVDIISFEQLKKVE